MSFQIKTEKILSAENCKRIIAMGISLKDSVENISKELIEEYDSTKTYSPDMACYYNDYLYRCLFATTGEFDINSWKKVGDSLELVNKAQVEAMLGLTPDELDTLANIILDSEVRLDKTWSSSKIYESVQEAIRQNKKFTLEEFAKANKASYTVTDSVDTMTDQSTIYLLKNDTTYDMYIVQVDGTPTKIGDVNIDLTQFYTKTEIDKDFVKKTDADGKYALITTVDNHINDTVAHMTQSEKDSYALKSSITNTINSTSTSTNIASAKGVYENAIKDKNIKTYTTLEQIGLATTTCTIKDIWDKMPVNSIAIIDTNGSIVTDLDVIRTALNLTDSQNIYGFLTIGKFKKRTILEFRKSYTDSATEPETFIVYCVGGSCTSIQWKKMILSSIDGANKVTTITFSDTTNYKQHYGSELKYYTLNGVCYVSGGIDCVTPSSALKYLAKLSKPKLGYSYAKGIVVNSSASDTSHLTIYIDGSGNLGLQNGLAGGSYRFSFSYPIA